MHIRTYTHHDPFIYIYNRQAARFCALQDAAKFHAVCTGWCDGLAAPASPFYPEVTMMRGVLVYN